MENFLAQQKKEYEVAEITSFGNLIIIFSTQSRKMGANLCKKITEILNWKYDLWIVFTHDS